MKKVLITGMSGLIGGILKEHLQALGGYELSALNRRPVEGVECFQADISDLDAIKPALAGKDVVVHLAAYLGADDDWEQQLASNVVGTYNIYEAARLAGVQRVVFGSSGAVVSALEKIPPYEAIVSRRYDEVPSDWKNVTHETVSPIGLYGASKIWGESLGRHYSDTHGVSALCVRIGRVTAENRPGEPRAFSVFTSHRDIAQILQKCIDAPDDLKHGIFFATSKNKWGYRDLEHPRRVLGFEPQDSADDYL
ncbi:MAG: NAD(P)-dependent oxidoreductase [Phycisphaerae bacterium]|nr:NAD(P)-dependent oxidoreductase [Phycisphaerae bacterium]